MKRPRMYGAMVELLPFSSERKGWLRMNWVGILMGAFLGNILRFWLILRYCGLEGSCPVNHPIRYLKGGCGNPIFGCQDVLMFITLTIIFALIGAFIQSILRGRR